jgi:hypothetical protein
VGARVGAEAERRQLTVMFCDLVGSTALSARLAKKSRLARAGVQKRARVEFDFPADFRSVGKDSERARGTLKP